MRCVSKCFIGRSFKVYFLLLFGAVIGFSISSFIQVVDQQANFQLNKAISLRDSIPVRISQLGRGNSGPNEDYGHRLDLSDYEYIGELEVETKQKAEMDHQEVIADANIPQLKPPSSPSLTVPNLVSIGNKEYKHMSWQERNKLGTGDMDAKHQRLSDELASRRTMLVGVITSLSKLMTQTLAIQETWGSMATKVIYFVGDVGHTHDLPHKIDVVQLEGVDDELGGRELKEISAIEYLMHNYLDHVDWFLLVGDEAYVVAQQLEKRLNRLDARYTVYMGLLGAGGMESEAEKGDRLCQRDPGVVYSQALLRGLMQYLPTCRHREQEGEDGTLHKCLREMKVKCTQAQEMNDLFIDVKSTIESPMMFAQPELAKAVVLHPVSYPKYMYRLHTFFMELEYNSSLARLKETEVIIQSAQPFIPSHLRSPVHFHKSSYDAASTSPQAHHVPTMPEFEQGRGMVVLQRRVPKNKFELNNWEYFNQTRLMSIMNESPARGIIGGFREEARFVLTKAMHLANQGLPQSQRYLFYKLENGYHRVDPMRGSEFILDFVFHRVSNRKVNIKKRISILRPFHENILKLKYSENLPTVNFLVTLSGLSVRLQHFLVQYERNVLQEEEDATLTIVLFESPDDLKVRQMVQQYLGRYQDAHMKVVDLKGEFARGVGLHHGMKLFSKDQLVFIVDVDLDISTDFLQRCRLNTIQENQVYFPVFFKLYNTNFVSRYHRGNHSMRIARHQGHWAHYSYGMVCIYAEDYHKLKGFDISMRGWGEEDVDLLNQVLKSDMEVFRAPDPGLIHNWHAKACDKEKITNSAAYEHCLRSKGENLADRIELAQYVFENERINGRTL